MHYAVLKGIRRHYAGLSHAMRSTSEAEKDQKCQCGIDRKIEDEHGDRVPIDSPFFRNYDPGSVLPFIFNIK